MRLLIVRHAQTTPSSSVIQDLDRPLTEQGRARAMELGADLAGRNERPTRVLSSPAVRARETTQALVDAMALETPVEWIDDLYGAEPLEVWGMVEGSPDDASIMIVGHNPTLKDLVEALAGPIPHEGASPFPPGSVACVEVSDPAEGTPPGSLVYLERPEVVAGD